MLRIIFRANHLQLAEHPWMLLFVSELKRQCVLVCQMCKHNNTKAHTITMHDKQWLVRACVWYIVICLNKQQLCKWPAGIVTKSQWIILTLSLPKHTEVFGYKNTYSGLIYTLLRKTGVWHALKVELALWVWRGWGIYVTLWIRAVRTCHPPRRQEARWDEVWWVGVGGGGFWKGESHKFHLEASIFSQQVLASHGEGQVRATACGAVSVLNISRSPATWRARIDYSIVTRLGLGLNQSDTDRQLENLFWHEDGKRQKSK